MLVCYFRVVDVGSEWRTFSNDKNTKDASRVGAAEVQTCVYLLLCVTIITVYACALANFSSLKSPSCVLCSYVAFNINNQTVIRFKEHLALLNIAAFKLQKCHLQHE